MVGPGEPDEAHARILGDFGVAPRVADEDHVAWCHTYQGRPLRELLFLGVIGPPPVDRGREFDQPVALAEPVDDIGPGTAAQQDRHARSLELGQGGPGAAER